MTRDKLTRVRNQLIGRLLDELKSRSGKSAAKIAAVLLSTTCECYAAELLFGVTPQVKTRFDPYYRMKHEGAKLKLIDLLKSALTSAGVTFQLLTEQEAELGRNDVVIVVSGGGLCVQGNGRRIVVEVKASLGLVLAQLERYMLKGDPLLLVRIMTGQVTLLDPDDHMKFLDDTVLNFSDKAQRMLEWKPILVPGYECRDCPATGCRYNKALPKPSWNVFSMKPEEFDADLTLYLRNLYPTVSKAVQMILRELEIKTEPITISEKRGQ
jgi:hypothetical protein